MAKKEAGKSFLLRLDVATMEKIEAWAAQEFRSVNGQIQWIIAMHSVVTGAVAAILLPTPKQRESNCLRTAAEIDRLIPAQLSGKLRRELSSSGKLLYSPKNKVAKVIATLYNMV